MLGLFLGKCTKHIRFTDAPPKKQAGSVSPQVQRLSCDSRPGIDGKRPQRWSGVDLFR